jgi:hypothetical protein
MTKKEGSCNGQEPYLERKTSTYYADRESQHGFDCEQYPNDLAGLSYLTMSFPSIPLSLWEPPLL